MATNTEIQRPLAQTLIWVSVVGGTFAWAAAFLILLVGILIGPGPHPHLFTYAALDVLLSFFLMIVGTPFAIYGMLRGFGLLGLLGAVVCSSSWFGIGRMLSGFMRG
jgi:hypothetical protein